jgi:hypothetical protein
MLTPLHGLGDSLMCGLQGYDFAPQKSFFALLARAAGEEVRFPRLRWNIEGFAAGCALPAGSAELARLLDDLAQGRIELRVEDPGEARGLFAVPGFSVGAFLHAHEQTPGLPRHLQALSRPFLNPRGEAPLPPLARALQARPARTCVVWLGGVDWITCLLSERKRCEALCRGLLRHFAVLIARLAAPPRGGEAPLLVLGGAISPTRLPLTRPAGADRVMSFRTDAEVVHACDRISAADWTALERSVERFNEGLRSLVEKAGGIFVDLDRRVADAFCQGEIRDGGVSIPARDLVGLDLVHPSEMGHAAIARWFAEAIEERTGERLELPGLAEVWRAEQESRLPVDEESWRRLMGVVYERYLYKPEMKREGGEMAPREGLEPPTNRLTADRSTTELPRNVL